MAACEAFDREEWAQLLRAPFLVGLLVASASPSGPIGSLKEAWAAQKLLVETRANSGGNALVDSVLAALDTDAGRAQAEIASLASLTPDEAHRIAREIVVGAGRAARAKMPESAEGYIAWLLSLGRAVAEASKEGGILGIGAQSVSPAEEALLARLASLLAPV